MDENIKCSKCKNPASIIIAADRDSTIPFCKKHAIPVLKKIVDNMFSEEELRTYDEFMKNTQSYREPESKKV